MEPCLTGRFRLDEGPVRRAFTEQFRTTKTLNLVFSVFCLGIGTYTLIRCLRSGSFGFYQLFPTLFCFAAAGFLLYQAFLVLPRGIRRFLELIDRDIGSRDSDLIVRFYPDRFVTENSRLAEQTDRSYGDLTDVFRGKTTVTLVMKDRKSFSLELDRFENGTEADFWKLMCAVCPDAVPKKYRQGGPAGGR